MQNPFEEILFALRQLQDEVKKINSAQEKKLELIDRAELCRRLNLSETTILNWKKKKIIPEIEVGAVVRYNWPDVVDKLQKRKSKVS